MIKKFINIEFRVTNGLIISGKLIIVSYSAYQSILNEENYREFVEAENMELFSIKENEVLRTNLGIRKLISFLFLLVVLFLIKE